MFKDYDRYLKTSLKVYLFVLCCIFIMKLVGLDYFGIDVNNNFLVKSSDLLIKTHIADLINVFIIYTQFYFYLSIVCNKRKLYMGSFIATLLNVLFQIILTLFSKMNINYSIISIIIMIIFPMIIKKEMTIKKQIKIILLITFYQFISLFIRDVNFHYEYSNFIIDIILNIDQLLLLAISYNVNFLKGDNKICGLEQVVGLFLQKKMNLKQSLKELPKKLHKFKLLNKEDKITYIIYFILSFIWNILNVIIILFIAKLNHTFIECLFILTSFWLSKRAFGKAFHLKSMIQCFIVSNLTYYCLNRLTAPLGVSILIPIMLGVGLSYVTSKLVKKTYKPLYKNMPVEQFDETILKVVDKYSVKYNICYDYFINDKSAIYLSGKYHYTPAGIMKIKDRVNKKIKELN